VSVPPVLVLASLHRLCRRVYSEISLTIARSQDAARLAHLKNLSAHTLIVRMKPHPDTHWDPLSVQAAKSLSHADKVYADWLAPELGAQTLKAYLKTLPEDYLTEDYAAQRVNICPGLDASTVKSFVQLHGLVLIWVQYCYYAEVLWQLAGFGGDQLIYQHLGRDTQALLQDFQQFSKVFHETFEQFHRRMEVCYNEAVEHNRYQQWRRNYTVARDSIFETLTQQWENCQQTVDQVLRTVQSPALYCEKRARAKKAFLAFKQARLFSDQVAKQWQFPLSSVLTMDEQYQVEVQLGRRKTEVVPAMSSPSERLSTRAQPALSQRLSSDTLPLETTSVPKARHRDNVSRTASSNLLQYVLDHQPAYGFWRIGFLGLGMLLLGLGILGWSFLGLEVAYATLLLVGVGLISCMLGDYLTQRFLRGVSAILVGFSGAGAALLLGLADYPLLFNTWVTPLLLGATIGVSLLLLIVTFWQETQQHKPLKVETLLAYRKSGGLDRRVTLEEKSALLNTLTETTALTDNAMIEEVDEASVALNSNTIEDVLKEDELVLTPSLEAVQATLRSPPPLAKDPAAFEQEIEDTLLQTDHIIERTDQVIAETEQKTADMRLKNKCLDRETKRIEQKTERIIQKTERIDQETHRISANDVALENYSRELSHMVEKTRGLAEVLQQTGHLSPQETQPSPTPL